MMAPPTAPGGGAEQSGWFAQLWLAIGVGGRIAVIALAVTVVIWLIYLGMKQLGSRGRRLVLIGFTTIALLSTAGFGIWARQLPEPVGTYFVLWHQIVRAVAALSAAGFVVGAFALALPVILDAVERGSFPAYVAARHVRAGKSGFLTVISVLSILGVAVSCLALCAVISIMGGFGADLKRKILGNNAHVRIDTRDVNGFDDWRDTLDKVRTMPGVVAATPIAGGEAMSSSNSNTAGVIVRGVDEDTISTVIDLTDNIEVGKFEYLQDPIKLTQLPPDETIGLGAGGQKFKKGPDIRRVFDSKLDPDVARTVKPPDVHPGLIIGRELAKTLHLYVGDEVRLISPMGDLGPMGVLPRTRTFRVAAIFYSGMYEYDASHVYMKLDDAQEFLDLGPRITGIDVKVKNSDRVEQVSDHVRTNIGREDLRVRDWKELNRNLFSALALEKVAMFVVLCLAIIVASFCIICTLLLMVTEKSKEIAILKSLGATDRAILGTFMLEGVIIGAIGTLSGVVTGLVLVLSLKWFGLRLDPEVYYVDRLPINVDPLDYSLIAISALAITTLATVYPAWAASRIRPVDGIRYE